MNDNELLKQLVTEHKRMVEESIRIIVSLLDEKIGSKTMGYIRSKYPDFSNEADLIWNEVLELTARHIIDRMVLAPHDARRISSIEDMEKLPGFVHWRLRQVLKQRTRQRDQQREQQRKPAVNPVAPESSDDRIEKIQSLRHAYDTALGLIDRLEKDIWRGCVLGCDLLNETQETMARIYGVKRRSVVYHLGLARKKIDDTLGSLLPGVSWKGLSNYLDNDDLAYLCPEKLRTNFENWNEAQSEARKKKAPYETFLQLNIRFLSVKIEILKHHFGYQCLTLLQQQIGDYFRDRGENTNE